MDHGERLLHINNKTLLSLLPKGEEYRITGSGRIIHKDSSRSDPSRPAQTRDHVNGAQAAPSPRSSHGGARPHVVAQTTPGSGRRGPAQPAERPQQPPPPPPPRTPPTWPKMDSLNNIPLDGPNMSASQETTSQ